MRGQQRLGQKANYFSTFHDHLLRGGNSGKRAYLDSQSEGTAQHDSMLEFAFCCCNQHHDQKQLADKRVYLA